MSALVSVTISEGGTLRRLFGAQAYRHLHENDAATGVSPRPAHRAGHRPAGGPPSDTETKVLGALAEADQAIDRYTLADCIALSPDAIAWHVRRLTDRGHVTVTLGERGRKCYAITDAGRTALQTPTRSVHGGRMAEVYEWLSTHPGANVADIAAALSLNAQGVRGVLERLEGSHRVEVVPGISPRRYRVKPEPRK